MQNTSNLIVKPFNFLSSIQGRHFGIDEIKSIYEMMSDDGIFITIGQDETFSDDINRLIYEHVPENKPAKNFESWRQTKLDSIESPHNCGLDWMKRGLSIPIEFNSLYQSANVMGCIFGRDAAKEIITWKRTTFWTSMGITYNTKDDLKHIITSVDKTQKQA